MAAFRFGDGWRGLGRFAAGRRRGSPLVSSAFLLRSTAAAAALTDDNGCGVEGDKVGHFNCTRLKIEGARRCQVAG